MLTKTLTTEDRWVCWKFIDGRKVSMDANTESFASLSDPATWTTYKKATASVAADQSLEGVGFMLGEGFAGVDLDACIDETGEIQSWASDVISKFPTYCEVSPSGTGVKIFLKGEVSRGRKKTLDAGDTGKAPAIEIYSGGDRWQSTGGRRFDPKYRKSRNDRTGSKHRSRMTR